MDSSVLRELESLSFAGQEEEVEEDWLQSCQCSLSPFGHVLVMAYKLKLAFLTRARREGALFSPRVFDRTYDGLEGDRATAVLCLPVADSRPGKESQGSGL